MKKPKQLSFVKSMNAFGGSLLAGKRKEARPLSTKHPLHLILKSAIELALAKVSSKFKVKIYGSSKQL